MDTEDKESLVLDVAGFDKHIELVATFVNIGNTILRDGKDFRFEWQQLIHDIKSQRMRLFEAKKELERTKKEASETLQSFTQSHRNLVDKLAEERTRRLKLELDLEKMKEEFSGQVLRLTRETEAKPTPARIRGQKAEA